MTGAAATVPATRPQAAPERLGLLVVLPTAAALLTSVIAAALLGAGLAPAGPALPAPPPAIEPAPVPAPGGLHAARQAAGRAGS